MDPKQTKTIKHFLATVADSDSRLGGANLISFQVCHVYFFVGRGPKSTAKLDGDHDRICSLDPPLVGHGHVDEHHPHHSTTLATRNLEEAHFLDLGIHLR